MSLYHKFFLLNRSENNYDKYLGIKSDVNIHDDLIRRMIDTLYWIPTENLLNSERIPFEGFDTQGMTIIKDEGAKILFHIISAWIDLFSFSPKKLKLSGPWTPYYNEEGKPEDDGYYRTLEFDRDQVITNLKALANYAQEASKGDYFILHIGI